MHGGVGLNTMSREYFEENNQPVSLRDEFIESLKNAG
jgi:metallo-beta-lactamase class B